MKIKTFCFIILLILIIFNSVLYSQSFNPSHLTLKEANGLLNDSQKTFTEKSSFLAGTLSFIVPGLGLGQIYNGQTNKFFIHSLISTGLIVSFFMLEGKPSDINFFGTPRTISMGSLAFMFAYTINWTWSIVDAVISAVKINKQIERQRKTGYNNIRLNFAPGIGRNNKPNLNISVYF